VFVRATALAKNADPTAAAVAVLQAAQQTKVATKAPASVNAYPSVTANNAGPMAATAAVVTAHQAKAVQTIAVALIARTNVN